MKKEMDIVSIQTESGWYYDTEGHFESFQVNGEMASITWYKYINKFDKLIVELNPRYIIKIIKKPTNVNNI